MKLNEISSPNSLFSESPARPFPNFRTYEWRLSCVAEQSVPSLPIRSSTKHDSTKHSIKQYPDKPAESNKVWHDYLKHDPTGPWADEVRQKKLP